MYIKMLANKTEFEKDVNREVRECFFLMQVYIAGLKRDSFPLDFSYDLEKIPERLHATIAKLALLKSEEYTGGKDFIFKSVEEELKRIKYCTFPLTQYTQPQS